MDGGYAYSENELQESTRESGLMLLDCELDRMDKILGRAEEILGAVLLQPRLDTVEQDKQNPESPLRTRVERLQSQCSSWDRLLNRVDV